MHLLCLGYGYTARRFIHLHRQRFASIAATWRSAESHAALGQDHVQPVAIADRTALSAAVRAADVILISAGPDERGDPFVDTVGAAPSGTSRPRAVLYLSTVGVYGDHQGGWVTETTPPRPTSARSHWRLAAEKAWLALPASTAEVQVLRLAGIYGPHRSAVDNLRAGTAKRIIKPGQVFNRIHVDDIGETLLAALARGHAGAIWNVADDEPAPPQDVVAYAAQCLGMPPPPEIPFENARLSPMALSFYGETKRISNRAIREKLGVQLRYPTYREGIAALAGCGPV